MDLYRYKDVGEDAARTTTRAFCTEITWVKKKEGLFPPLLIVTLV